MMHEGHRLERQIARLERELEHPASVDRTTEIRAAINRLKTKKQEWERAR